MNLDEKIREKLADWHRQYFGTAHPLINAMTAVIDLHEPIKVYPVIPDTDDLLETPTHAVCRECSDEDTVADLEGNVFIDTSDGVRSPCKTVTALAAALGIN